jgi:hypothetical protein
VASTNEPLREATADVFEGWIARASARMVESGIAEDAARQLAIVLIALLEGAFLLCRSLRTTDPLDITGAAAAAAVAAAWPGSAAN